MLEDSKPDFDQNTRHLQNACIPLEINMSNFLTLHHTSLIVTNTSDSLDFYCNTLGMEQVERADLPFPGAWLGIGNQQIHLLELPNPDPVDGRPEHGGRDRHVAIVVRNLEAIRKSLDAADITYTLSRSGRAALFCRDPDGNALEMIEAT